MKNLQRSKRVRYRFPPIDPVETRKAEDLAVKHASRALLFSFLSIFLHTAKLNSAYLSVAGLKFSVGGEHTIKGAACFMSIYFAILAYNSAIVGIQHGLLRMHRTHQRFWLAVAKNKGSVPDGLNAFEEAQHTKKFAIALERFAFYPMIVLVFLCLVIFVVGVAVSIDDMLYTVFAFFWADFF